MYPNEHSARQRDPGEFDPNSFRRKQIAPGISLIMGHMKDGAGKMTVQSVRFDASKHTPTLAKKWLEDHDFDTGSFEPASGDSSKSTDGILAFLGGAVKALGNGKVGGYLVTFGKGPEDADLSNYRDFFDATTDFAIKSFPAPTAVYYHHGGDETIGKRRLSDDGVMKVADATGIWVESQMKMRDDYDRAIYRMAEEGKLNWSSGTANHLVERTAIKSGDRLVAHHVDYWPLGLDASLTPTAADWRNRAYALKSVSVPSLKSIAEEYRDTRPSLAERTERWLEDGTNIVAGYRDVLAAEVKIGRKLSAARVDRLKSAHEMMGQAHATIGDILSETVGSDAPGTGSASIPAQPGTLEGEMNRLRMRATAMSMMEGR